MEHSRESIIRLLETNDKAIGRAIVALYNRQTESEKCAENTVESNGIGFNGIHGNIGASMAKFYIANGYLTYRQIQYWRFRTKSGKMRIAIYANQLLDIAREHTPK